MLIEADPEQVAQWLVDDEAVIVDVREADEYQFEHIPGALLMPLSTFDPAKLPPAEGKRLVLHCQKGGRSAKAAMMMMQAGQSEATHLAGGLDAWKAAGLEVESAFGGPKLS